MKLLLVHPPIRQQVWAGVPEAVNSRGSHLFPPLAVMTLSAYIKNRTGHSCEVMDFRLDEPSADEIARRIAAARPAALGVTANSHNLVNVRTVVEAARRALPDLPIILGGPHANAFPDLAARFPGIDYAVTGDGEKPLAAILDALVSGADPLAIPGVLRVVDGRVERGPAAAPLEHLDGLPFPDRDWMPPETYFTPGMREKRTTTIISSRGCPFDCIYCSVPHRYRSRGAADIVAEVAECEQKHGLREIHFVDDNFNLTIDRVNEISETILRRGVKMLWGFKGGCRRVDEQMLRLAGRAGCVRAHYGVETYTDEGLRALDKQLSIAEVRRAFDLTRRAGILAIAYIIIGSPHERTLADVLGVRSFIAGLAPDYVVYSLFSPYPESLSFRLGAERGLWAADVWEKFMLEPRAAYDLPTAWTEHLTKTELIDAFKRVNLAFYFHPRTLWRTLRRLRTWAEFKRIIQGGVSLLRVWAMPAAGRKV